jgi:16S rRNA processing protein RimM
LDEVLPGYVAVGRVLGPWGVRGELKVEPLAPKSVLEPHSRVSLAGNDYEIERSFPGQRFLRVKLAGVDTREGAQSLRGSYLQVPEAQLEPLPTGQYYRFQLIGLAVRSLDGDDLGVVADVISARENDVYVVNGRHGEVLLPATEDVVRDIDLAKRVMTIEIIPGLLP